MNLETGKDWLKYARERISNISDTPNLDVEILFRTVCLVDRTALVSTKEIFLDNIQLDNLEILLERRIKGEPIAYLLGEKEFWSMKLYVTEDTLIPRPETELLVECALSRIGPSTATQVLDLGTGSGAIALALALERPSINVTATDICQKALQIASRNAKLHGIKNVVFRAGNWFDAVPKRLYSLITCNPPYVAPNDPYLDILQTKFEPRLALMSDDGGMAAFQKIISAAPHSLAPRGWLLLEHGHQQQYAVENLLVEAKFDSIIHYRDMRGKPRVTAASITDSSP